ncbi:hypothetical protein IJD44_02120 [bacterium]|nr:hypothetical protein [bacterium]
MNITSKQEKNNEIKPENNIQLNEQDVAILEQNVNMPFSNILSQQLTGSAEILNNSMDYFNYDSINMSFEDAMFFVNLTKEGQFTVNATPEGTFQSIVQTQIAQTTAVQKTVEVTNQITELITKAQSTQRPVRISFDNDVSVIIKIDKHGKLTAEFIPGSIEVENYLRNNISALKQKFDEQNLPYNDLFYRQNGKQGKRQDKERGEK